MQNIDTKQAEELLRKYYKKCYDDVADSDFYRLFADEKLQHSFQVIGAGNYIMRHEKVFQTDRPDFLRSAKLAYLFHDTGRFKEIECKCKEEPSPQKHNHAMYSYEILKAIPEYDKVEILLPIKYHSGMIEKLYEGDDFKSLKDKQTQEDVKHISFLVRDADKIANYYLMKTSEAKSDKVFNDLFLAKCQFGGVSDAILRDFLAQKVTNNADIRTGEDWMLSYLSWTFDLNYKASFDFCTKTGCFKNLLEIFNKYTSDKGLQKQVEATLYDYINNRYQQFKGE